MEWLERSDDEADTFLTDQDLLSKNIVRAPRKLNIDTETAFCDSAIVQEVLRAKVRNKRTVLMSKNKTFRPSLTNSIHSI